MPVCFHCRGRPVVSFGRLMCKKHFSAYFEGKVKKAIRRFGLFERNHKLAVACSGGKDSTVLLFVLKKLGYNVEALAVDEGIKGYRDCTLRDLRLFCKKHGVKLNVISFAKVFGFSLDELLKKANIHPCMACGVLRRYLLNKAARNFDRLATGHNLDDEAQSIVMNLVKSNVHLLARLGPVTGLVSDKLFVQRVKPLYFCSEKEVASYAFLHGFQIKFIECPNAESSFRAKIRDMLNEFESQNPGSKQGIVNSFIKMMPILKAMPIVKGIVYCGVCGEPSSRKVCSACSIIKEYDKL